jgi:hypothetical protein
MGERRGIYRFLVGKPEAMRPLGRPICRWEDNNKINLQEVGCGGMDWIELAQDRKKWRALRAGSGQEKVAGTCECSNELSGSIKCRKFLDYLRTCLLLKKDSAP